MYQADQPMFPFLSEDMHKLIKGKDKQIDGVMANVLLCTLQCIRNTHKFIVWLFSTFSILQLIIQSKILYNCNR